MPYWKISMAAMVRRMRDLGVTSEDGYGSLYISIDRRRRESLSTRRWHRSARLRVEGDVLPSSFMSSEDEFMKAAVLPGDLMMTAFGGYRGAPQSMQAQVLRMPTRPRMWRFYILAPRAAETT